MTCLHPTDQLRFQAQIRTVPLKCKCGAVISWWKPYQTLKEVAVYVELLKAMSPDRRPVSIFELYPDAQVGPVDRLGHPALELVAA